MLKAYLQKEIHAAPLVTFRVLFGLLMAFSMLRFWANSWIADRYITPDFFFPYQGFEFIQPLGNFTYVLFALCFLSAIGIALGWKYRLSVLMFFLSFTYIELIDKTTYLNHYYFVSVVAGMLLFLPAHHYLSLDALRQKSSRRAKVPAWSVHSLQLMLALVYIYAGLAKLNSDWLVEAMPLKIWLPGRDHLPIIGELMHQNWFHYTMSWGGAVYDLTIPFLLWWSRTRVGAFLAVVFFHLFTAVLFPIGMFPYIMIAASLVFFPASWHHKAHLKMLQFCKLRLPSKDNAADGAQAKKVAPSAVVVAAILLVQVVWPWRAQWQSGELFWHEQGFRFSWRVMLMEKAGFAQFKIVDAETEKWVYVENRAHLTAFQEKQMAFQPDFILQFAQYLEKYYTHKGWRNPKVYVDSYVALNGRSSRRFVRSDVDLTNERETQKTSQFLMPFNDEIVGM